MIGPNLAGQSTGSGIRHEQGVRVRFKDPVCGMEIRWEEAVSYAVVGPVVVYFCCHGCASRFHEDPTRHVDVDGWLTDAPTSDDVDCATRPLPLAGGDGPVRRSLRLGAVPKVGRITLDELESLIEIRWRQLLGSTGGPLRTRVLERALLVCAFTGPDEERRHDIDRMLAAEVVRLRSRQMDRDRVEEELQLLPEAFADALAEANVDPTEARRLERVLQDRIAEVRVWIFTRPGGSRRDASSVASRESA